MRYFENIKLYVQKNKKTDILLLFVGIAVFLAITIANAPRASIWFDEAFGAYLVQFSFWDIAKYTAADVHPPLYYWLLKIWTGMFGISEMAIRSLSILFGASTITAVFLLARKLFGRRVAWVSLVFLALSPMLIRYSDEGRMYTMAALIVIVATHVLLKALETKKKSLWVWYAVLVSLGMWTHYFTALAWLAHWAWRAGQSWHKGMALKSFNKTFFTKEWIFAHILAIALYVPWIPALLYQFGVVQLAGFWIGPVGVDTPVNYISSYFYYLEHDQTINWAALAMIIVVLIVAMLTPKTVKALKKTERSSFLLISSLVAVPPILLFFASLPPLQSSFVDRYLLPSIVTMSVFIAVVLVVGTRKWKPAWQIFTPTLIVAMMIFGITNVFYYGNFNKNSGTHVVTRQVVQAAQAVSEPGVPIVSNSPWIFYEAAPYATSDHPIYYIDENTDYYFGSLAMLKNEDVNKIKDLSEFEKQNPVIWYLGATGEDDVPAYKTTWKKIKTIAITDHITGKTSYKITKYETNAQ